MTTKTDEQRSAFPWRILGWGTAACLLLLPLVARAPWTLSDYVVASLMLGGFGLAIELAVRASANWAYRAGATLAIGAAVLLFWVNGAVGLLGDEDNPANLVFAAVIATAAIGAALARFRPAGMARTMFAAAALQVLIGVVALAAGLGSPGTAGIYEAVMGTTLFATFWLIAGALFRKAAREQFATA